MITIPSHGIYPDEVGLRYLIQGSKNVSNAFGFKDSPNFRIKGPKYHYPCPHHHEVKDWGCGNDDELIKFLSPIPSEQKAFVYEGDRSKLSEMAKFSGANCISAWMLNSFLNERIALASNIQLTIVMDATTQLSEIIDELQNAMDFSYGKVIFHGDYYFSSKFPRIGEPVTVTDPAKVGATNMFNYLKERD